MPAGAPCRPSRPDLYVVDPTKDPLVTGDTGKSAVGVAEKVLAQQAAAVGGSKPRRRGRYRY